MEARLILVDRGNTDLSAEGRIEGWQDVPLNKDGIKHAQRIAENLKDRRIDIIYSSDLQRDIRTAEIVAEQHKGLSTIIPVHQFKEANRGFWEGLTSEEVKIQFRETYTRWLKAPLKFPPPNGESLKKVKARVIGTLNNILATRKEKNICIVTDRTTNLIIRHHYTDGHIETLIRDILDMPYNECGWEEIEVESAEETS